MADSKILRFTGASSALPTDPLKETSKAQQLSLFEQMGENLGRIVFLDISWLAEETLLNVMTRNGVTALFDLRPKPVFERPRFRHRHVVQYFFQNNVQYLEYAMLARDIRDDWRRSSGSPPNAEAPLREMLSRGLTICLFDEATRSAGWIDDVRRLVRSTPGYRAEVHPRALVGASYRKLHRQSVCVDDID